MRTDPSNYDNAVACHVCGQTHLMPELREGYSALCVRCGTHLSKRTNGSLHKTAAFTLSALLLYVPAYYLPILNLQLYGESSSTTVWEGVQLFYRDQQYTMAAVVLLASLIIPVIKLTGLFFLVVSTALQWRMGLRFRTGLYRFIDLIGRWAMLDVFALAVWVATVKLQKLAQISPGRGLLPFGGVVVLTLLASASFDPQLIWERHRRSE